MRLLLDVETILAEASQNPCSFIRFLVERGWPKGLRAEFVGEFVDGSAELVDEVVDFVEA